LLERLGPGHDRAAAWLANDRAILRIRRGDKTGGLVDLREALALKQRTLGPNHPDVGLSLATMGALFEELGDSAGALDAAEKFLETYRGAYGDDSPLLAHPLFNRATALALGGRHAEAEKDLRDAITRWTSLLGPDHSLIGHGLTALGKSLIELDRAREAVPILERAVRIRERAEPLKEPVAESRFALARARWRAGRQDEETRALVVAARDTYRASPKHAREAAEIDAWLAANARSGGVAAARR
jgi:serine/threonine-protein kinase